jgi:acyl dehydratase
MTSPPQPKHFYEDLVEGATMHLGSTSVSKEEIIAYARAFDPQPLHLDEAAAKQSMIGGLCASGWHSCAILMRLLCDSYLLEAASLGSPGIEEVKFLKPVFPGDRLSLRFTCGSKRLLASRPNVGIARLLFELENQNGDVVLSWDCNQLMGLRAPVGEGARP